ncbi:hypothetical protein CAEBREN_24206 [Caenorhabditis brenneri]|uniref:G-protein coupled receptors family 1 profile domain-containing protein n=1 Tax=Caenorhabditis brenneri TaxID=135651 RepID=G0M9E9_CAEBE|nr:hypothetical protein CAEBREN_24206 [Caenorhabditis brenneri]
MREEAIRFFDRYDEPIRSIMIFAYKLHHSSTDVINTIDLFLSCFALFVNVFHLFILSRKALRSSGINVLMIGLAVNDILCFSIVAYSHISFIIKANYDECALPPSYASVLVLNLMNYFYEIFQRSSPWLGVIMAFIRLLISIFPFNNTIGKMANPTFAVWSFCGFLENYSQPVYHVHTFEYIDSLIYVKGVFVRIRIVFKVYFIFFHCLSSKSYLKHLPIVILPVLTVGLIIVLRKINATKQRLQRNTKETKYQTTRLVTIMTCCLVVTEWATGLVEITFTFLSSESPLVILSAAFNMYFLLLSSLNSIAHCFITMLFTSQYRICARDVFPYISSRECLVDQKLEEMRFVQVNDAWSFSISTV